MTARRGTRVGAGDNFDRRRNTKRSLGALTAPAKSMIRWIDVKQKFFEDYRVGDTFPCGSHHVSEEEIVAFAAQWDRLPFHTDKQAAASSHFGGLVASGCHVLAIALRLINASDARPAILGAIGWDEVRFIHPVRPGDRLTLELTCLERRPSASRPDRGIVRQQFTLKNQHGEPVFRFKDMILVAKKAAG